MMLFVGGFLITVLCCAALGIGLLLRGTPLTGGCRSAAAGLPRCAGCPKRAAADSEERGEP